MPDPWQRVYLEYELSPLGHDLTLCVTNHMGVFQGAQPWGMPVEQRIQKQVIVQGGPAESGASISGWLMEIKIPFALFAPIAVAPPTAGMVWYGNVCRIDTEQGVQTHSAWSVPDGKSFHDYARFGRLQFV